MNIMTKGLTAVSSLALLLALGACGERVDTSERASTSATTEQSQTASNDAAKQDTTSASSSSTSVLGGPAESTGPMDDAQIVTKVKTALAADSDLSALKIDVDSKNGVVTLSGSAPDASAKERATEIAKNVKDVKSVENQLKTS
jgi:hyperosmotically inducible periplasmic protein